MRNHPLDTELLGKIVFARFLEIPLRSYGRLVARLDAAAAQGRLAAEVSLERLEGARLAAETGPGPLPPAGSLGVWRKDGGALCFAYADERYARLFRLDEPALCRRAASGGLTPDETALLARLRLVNSRNRLTHALLATVGAEQAEFLRSGARSCLRPLPQARIVERLLADPGLTVMADAGRISRLARRLSVTLPTGATEPLPRLLPRPRQVHGHLVEQLLHQERLWLAEGLIARPLTDGKIAELLARNHDLHLLRRSVGDIRHALGIPDWRARAGLNDYHALTRAFSAPVPLRPESLRADVPARSGVYEIRTPAAGMLPPPLPRDANGVGSRPCDIIYLGSAGDLRKRLYDHLHGRSGNEPLHARIAAGGAAVRFRHVGNDWRQLEKMLYAAYCNTFGGPPPCNRMSP